MKILTICLLLIINFTQALIGQNTDTENTISANITIPVIIEKIDETDYTDPNSTDLKYIESETTMGISIKIPRFPKCKIEVGGNYFKGSYTNEGWKGEKISFKGMVSEDRMMLLEVNFEMSYNKSDDSFLESETSKITLYNLPISHSSLPVADGICKFDKDISSVKVYDYKYTKTSSSRHYNKSLTKTFKRVNTELLPGLEDVFRFKIQLFMDGPPSYMLYVEDLPQDDLDYSLFLTERQNGEIQVEPNSVAIYKNDEGLNEASIEETKNHALFLVIDFANTPGLKVLERAEMAEMIKEAELSESELVTEEGKVRSGRLMIEEVALLVKTDLLNNYIEYKILSKEKATKITALNVNENNLGLANWVARSKSMELVLDYLKQN
ncbi:MAG: hypothetical protein ABFS32_12530 [Bacteroidota bacterium]